MTETKPLQQTMHGEQPVSRQDGLCGFNYILMLCQRARRRQKTLLRGDRWEQLQGNTSAETSEIEKGIRQTSAHLYLTLDNDHASVGEALYSHL